MNPDRHRCQACGFQHRRPKAHRAVTNILLAVGLSAVEVYAAVTLGGGWLAWALLAIAAKNILMVILIIVGLSIIATEQPEKAS